MKFRLVWYDTSESIKYQAPCENRYEYFGDRQSIWRLWFELVEERGCKHVEVYNLAGEKCDMFKGINGGMREHAL